MKKIVRNSINTPTVCCNLCGDSFTFGVYICLNKIGVS